MQKNNNKKKGNRIERLYSNIFKELGYSKCITTRQGSRLLDSCGVDLMNIPYNVQIKAGYNSHLNYIKEVRYVKDRLLEEMPEKDPMLDKPVILIHRKNLPQGRRNRIDTDEMVCMTFKDFLKIIDKKK